MRWLSSSGCFCVNALVVFFFFFSSRRRHTRYIGDWSSDVCSSDLSSAGGLGQWEGDGERQPAEERLVHLLAHVGGENRSEERRVGKECRARRSAREGKEKEREDRGVQMEDEDESRTGRTQTVTEHN